MEAMPYVWLALCVLFLLVEANTVSLVSVWFAGASLVAMVLAFFEVQLWVQVLVFAAVAGTLLALLRPFVRRYLRPRMTKTNLDTIPGKEATVIQTVDNRQATGRVRLGAMEWAARSSDGSILAENTPVRVEKIEGVKLIVTKMEE